MGKIMSAENHEISVINRKKFEELVGLVEDLVINKVRIEKMKNELSDNTYLTTMDQEIRIISQIQDTVKAMSKIKMKNIYSLLPDMISGKEVNLVMEGQEEEVENSVIGYINNILRYFIVNSVNNGSDQIKIQTIADNKNLNINVESNEENVNIENKCIDIVSLNEDEVYKLTKIIDRDGDCSELLKIRSDMIALGGNIKIQKDPNKYKHIAVTIPVASSITQALLVKVCNHTYAIPLEYIETIINKNSVEIKNSSGTEMIVYMDKVIPVIRIAEKLNIDCDDGDSTCILIVNVNNNTAAIMVDSLLDQTDVVIRPKPSVIKDVSEFKGTTILGDGIVTLVLDIASIVNGI